MNIIRLKETLSTNSWIAQNAPNHPEDTWVTAEAQTSGRGQRGNSWESEPGKNITFSFLWHPDNFPANRQFSISEATALAVADALGKFGVTASVKWPNDIYAGNKKICGILIEHSVLGTNISHSILGAGINVNQTEFLSDAPNPVSMAQILGSSLPLDEVEKVVMESIERRLQLCKTSEGRDRLHHDFLDRLYRGDGNLYPFEDMETGEKFLASIKDVERTGHLILSPEDGDDRKYAFKEVAFLINQ